jgi:hypothetical protein
MLSSLISDYNFKIRLKAQKFYLSVIFFTLWDQHLFRVNFAEIRDLKSEKWFLFEAFTDRKMRNFQKDSETKILELPKLVEAYVALNLHSNPQMAR